MSRTYLLQEYHLTGTNFLNSLSSRIKTILYITVDQLLFPFALWAAFSLRLGEFYVIEGQIQWLFFAVPLISLTIFKTMGVYQRTVRYLGRKEIMDISKAISVVVLLWGVLVFLSGIQGVPRSTIGIFWLLAIFFLIGERMFIQRYIINPPIFGGDKNIIIYGAGSCGVQLAVALRLGSEYNPVAFLDDDPEKQQKIIAGVPTFSSSQAQKLIREYKVKEVLLALPSISREQQAGIIEKLNRFSVQIRTIPRISELADGKIEVSDIRKVNLDDLLGRDPVAPDCELLKRDVMNKVVLVTGAGGSIGSELCLQIQRLGPAKLILLESSEFALYAIDQQLNTRQESDRDHRVPVIPCLASVTNAKLVQEILREHKVETIYHAAAYKHVPMVETNPVAGLENNIWGTRCMADAARACSVKKFILISTDKAVRPTNVMGASKRVAELYLQAIAEENSSSTIFTMVRFGNVLGSSGSVIPKFREQIRQGGPVTVTHPDITRYFMSISEAVELVLQAGAMATGGEVFVLDMGKPVKIADLARNMIRLSGYRVKDSMNPNGDIEIRYIGLRPGEKLYEELLIGNNTAKTSHPRIMQAREVFISLDELEDHLQTLWQHMAEGDIRAIKDCLTTFVDDYTPQHSDQA